MKVRTLRFTLRDSRAASEPEVVLSRSDRPNALPDQPCAKSSFPVESLTNPILTLSITPPLHEDTERPIVGPPFMGGYVGVYVPLFWITRVPSAKYRMGIPVRPGALHS